MATREELAALRTRLLNVQAAGIEFLGKVQRREDEGHIVVETLWEDKLITPDLRIEAEELRSQVKRISIDIAGAARGSPLLGEPDFQDLRHNTRVVLASLHFHQYRQHGLYIHHDEGVVLGVDPPNQEENPVRSVADARQLFDSGIAVLREMVDLLSPTDALQAGAKGAPTYRPNTAFIMMTIDRDQKDLEDIKNSIKEVCKEFGIAAITADDIEHEGVITDRILEEIETNEFLIADLTGERPNVYYEIGHAHARNRRVSLYRRKGTKLHFDVAHRNCPEYDNITDLKQQLRKRLEVLTNKPQKT